MFLNFNIRPLNSILILFIIIILYLYRLIGIIYCALLPPGHYWRACSASKIACRRHLVSCSTVVVCFSVCILYIRHNTHCTIEKILSNRLYYVLSLYLLRRRAVILLSFHAAVRKTPQWNFVSILCKKNATSKIISSFSVMKLNKRTWYSVGIIDRCKLNRHQSLIFHFLGRYTFSF